MRLFNWFKRKSKRYIHVFLEHPIRPTRELANDLCRKFNIDYEGVPDSRFFMYSVDSWPQDLTEYAVATVKGHKRYPKGNVGIIGNTGTLDFPDGKKLNGAIVQIIGPMAIETIVAPSSPGRRDDPNAFAALNARQHFMETNKSGNVEKLTSNGFDGISDSELLHLKGLPELTYLWIAGASDPTKPHITDDGLAYLSDLFQLEELLAGYNPITNSGLQHLRNLDNLRVLALNYTLITDAGLESLAMLKNLKTLNVSGTKVTSAGVAKLQACLPDCSIDTRH